MTLNNSRQFIILQRREMVAQLRLRKLTQREIVAELTKRGIVNPDTQAPYDLATVNHDLKALEKDWQKSAAQKVDIWKAQLLAELEELKRAAYAKGQLNIVRMIIDDQRKMLGTDAPTQANVKLDDWRSQALTQLANGEITPAALLSAFGSVEAVRAAFGERARDLPADLFAQVANKVSVGESE